MWNNASMEQLIARSKSDPETIGFINDCLRSFEAYHSAVFAEQTYVRLYSGVAEPEEFRALRTSLDRERTACHDALIVNVRILNRLCERAGLPPVYEGEVSGEKPYRRLVAGGVFEYLQYIIDNR